ncbi:hypothetical protein [Nocardia farcinica]|uniref:Uncharacterized protein n=1 Tax=Nocardia farcinica TaxID=37329 RepID=A0A449GQ33_NOCFR|nr:hypothetical protein [Nocardia farcinica]VFA94739.1 Uncharacterised protein [Nocardia farcinica]
MTGRHRAPASRIDWAFWRAYLVVIASVVSPLVVAWLIYFADH